MRTKLLYLSPIILLLIALVMSCSKNNVMGPNTLNNQVTFQVSQQDGLNGGTDFLFKPSADVKISQIVSMFPAQQFVDTIRTNNANYLYSKDTTYIIGEYTGVQNGQQWKFEFSGSTWQNASTYKVTTDYTVH